MMADIPETDYQEVRDVKKKKTVFFYAIGGLLLIIVIYFFTIAFYRRFIQNKLHCPSSQSPQLPIC